jgi:hypothetical protein
MQRFVVILIVCEIGMLKDSVDGGAREVEGKQGRTCQGSQRR